MSSASMKILKNRYAMDEEFDPRKLYMLEATHPINIYFRSGRRDQAVRNPTAGRPKEDAEMEAVGGRRAPGKTAAIGASPSLAAAGVRPALAHQIDQDRDATAACRAISVSSNGRWSRRTGKSPSCPWSS